MTPGCGSCANQTRRSDGTLFCRETFSNGYGKWPAEDGRECHWLPQQDVWKPKIVDSICTEASDGTWIGAEDIELQILQARCST